jgi:hypothetical protein
VLSNSVTIDLGFSFIEKFVKGKVGFGTRYPTKSLDISGNLKFTGDLYNDNSKTLLWYKKSNFINNNTTNTTAIGINTTTPQYKLDISGHARSTTYNNFSDQRLKSEITDETLGLDYINSLQPKQFYFNSSETKTHGFIAQDFENNELQDSILYTGADSLSLSYFDLLAPIIQSLKELNEEYNELKNQYENLI